MTNAPLWKIKSSQRMACRCTIPVDRHVYRVKSNPIRALLGVLDYGHMLPGSFVRHGFFMLQLRYLAAVAAKDVYPRRRARHGQRKTQAAPNGIL